MRPPRKRWAGVLPSPFPGPRRGAPDLRRARRPREAQPHRRPRQGASPAVVAAWRRRGKWHAPAVPGGGDGAGAQRKDTFGRIRTPAAGAGRSGDAAGTAGAKPQRPEWGRVVKRIEKRLRALEEHDNRVGYAAALQMTTDEDTALLGAYAERWLAAEAAGDPKPCPTPEEREAFGRLEEHRLRALRKGWGDSAY